MQTVQFGKKIPVFPVQKNVHEQASFVHEHRQMNSLFVLVHGGGGGGGLVMTSCLFMNSW